MFHMSAALNTRLFSFISKPVASVSFTSAVRFDNCDWLMAGKKLVCVFMTIFFIFYFLVATGLFLPFCYIDNTKIEEKQVLCNPYYLSFTGSKI